MATRTFTVDDLSGDEGATTIRFGFGETTYEVDLAEANTDKLEKALAPFIQVAREVVKRTTTGTSETAKVREWAVAQGIEVNQKGRVPADLVERYQAAQAA